MDKKTAEKNLARAHRANNEAGSAVTALVRKSHGLAMTDRKIDQAKQKFRETGQALARAENDLRNAK